MTQPIKRKGGIYIDKKYPNTFIMYYNGRLHYFENGEPYNSIDADVEITSNLKGLTLLEDYSLGCRKISSDECEWQIKASGLKATQPDKYIIGKGYATEKFFNEVMYYHKMM